MTVQTRAGICRLHLYTRGGLVSSVTVNMGAPDFAASAVPVTLDMPRVVNSPIEIGGTEYRVTCLSMGNPHCVVFTDNVDKVDLGRIGPLFENSPLFPHRTNTEFVRVVNPAMLKLRVFERGNGETSACGTGCCAAVCAAVENGCCEKNTDITVKTRGGDPHRPLFGRRSDAYGRRGACISRRTSVLIGEAKKSSDRKSSRGRLKSSGTKKRKQVALIGF